MRVYIIWLIVIALVVCLIIPSDVMAEAKAFKKFKGYMYVDLKPYAITPLKGNDAWHGATGGNNDLRELPVGENEFKGPEGKVPFYIIEAKNIEKDPVCVMGKGLNGAGGNFPLETEIDVNARCKEIYFLHATGWESPGIEGYYKFVMLYAGGKKEELPMTTHVNSDDWWGCCGQTMSDKNSVWGWQGGTPDHTPIGLINTRWKNPRSGELIKTITFISQGNQGTVPGVLGITLGGAMAVEPADKMTTTWGKIKRNF